MKNFLLTLIVACAAGAAAGATFFCVHRDTALHAAARERDAMVWLRTEFHLNDGQYAAIARLHAAYSVECGAHCAAIGAARRAAAALERTGHADPAALEAARRKVAEAERTCTDALRAHLRKVAALMNPADGDRYLQMLLPRVDSYGHQGAPTVRLDR